MEHVRHSQDKVVLAHERAALEQMHTSEDQVFGLIHDVDALSGKLYKELVDWHTRFPQKPTLDDSNAFWTQLKELRAAQFEMDSLLKAIKEQEQRQQSLKVQLEKAQDTVFHIEKAFDTYLDRLNERR